MHALKERSGPRRAGRIGCRNASAPDRSRGLPHAYPDAAESGANLHDHGGVGDLRMPASSRAVLIAALLGISAVCIGQEAPIARTLHYFVIDHSSSMVNQTAGRSSGSLWESFEGWFLENLKPTSVAIDGSADVHLMFFNQNAPGRKPNSIRKRDAPWMYSFSPWKSDSLEVAQRALGEVGRPTDSGEMTALWNALGVAMKQAEADADRYETVCIYLFTDGDDTHSSSAGERFTFDRGTKGKDQLIGVWRELVARHDNIYLLELPIGGDMRSPPLAPESEDPLNKNIRSSRLETGEYTLIVSVTPDRTAFPSLDQAQAMKLRMGFVGNGAGELESVKRRNRNGAQVHVSFRSDNPLHHVTVTPAAIDISRGEQVIKLEAKSRNIDNGVKGKLEFRYPDGVRKLRIEGTKWLPLAFAEKKAERVEIRQMNPGSERRWARGVPLKFSVDHTGTAVAWDFGDGTSIAHVANGEHTWERTGQYTLKCTASADGLAASERVAIINVIDPKMAIVVNPENGTSVGDAATFTARVDGAQTPDAIEWFIDGVRRESRVGAAWALEHSFATAGPHKVACLAHTDCGDVRGELDVQVEAGLAIQICGVPSTIEAGTTCQFEAEVLGGRGPQRVEWQLLDGKGLVVRNHTTVQPAGRILWDALLPDEVSGKAALHVKLEPEVAPGVAQRPALRDLVALDVKPAGLYSEKQQPGDGSGLTLDEEMPHVVMFSGSLASKITGVKWQVFNDGRELSSHTEEAPGRAESGGRVFTRSKWSARLAADKHPELPGRQIQVRAIPILDGKPEESKAAEWASTVRLRDVEYVLGTEGLDKGELPFGKALQLRVTPTTYVKSLRIRWDNESSEVHVNDPAASLSHTYPYDPDEAHFDKRVRVIVERIDGSKPELSQPFRHYIEPFRISNSGSPRIGHPVYFQIHPNEQTYQNLIQSVDWTIDGVGLNSGPKVVHSFDRAGPHDIHATIRMPDGATHTVRTLSIVVSASEDVKGNLQVEWPDGPGAVNLRVDIAAEHDYKEVEIEVLRDGTLLKTLKGTQCSYELAEADYGTYTHVAWATRATTSTNPNTRVQIASHQGQYVQRRYLEWILLVIASMVLPWIVLRATYLGQAPRGWSLKARWVFQDTDADFNPTREHDIGGPDGGPGALPVWGRWNYWKKPLTISTGKVAQLAAGSLDSEDRERLQGANEMSGAPVMITLNGLQAPEPYWQYVGETGQRNQTQLHVLTYEARAREGQTGSEQDNLRVWLYKPDYNEAKRIAVVTGIFIVLVLGNLIAAWKWFNIFDF